MSAVLDPLTETSPDAASGPGKPPTGSIERRIAVSAASDAGRMRTGNQDAHIVPNLLSAQSIERKGYLFAVADGSGGQDAGQMAAQLAVQTASGTYYADPDDDILTCLRRAAQEAQDAILFEQERVPEHGEMSATLLMAVLKDNNLYVANIGDSRCYRWRDGGMVQVTHDHSIAGEDVRTGAMNATKAEDHIYRGLLTRALGHPKASPEPEIQTFEWQANDRLLLCTDGLWDMLPDEKISALLSGPRVDEVAGALIEAANDAGGADNITCVVAFDAPVIVTEPSKKFTNKQFAIGVGGAVAAGLLVGGVALRSILAGGGAAAPAVPVAEPTAITAAPTEAAPEANPTDAAVIEPTAAPASTVAAPTPDAGAASAPPAQATTAASGVTISAGSTAVPKATAPAVPAVPVAVIDEVAKFCGRRGFSRNLCRTPSDAFTVKTDRVIYAPLPAIALNQTSSFDIIWQLDGQDLLKQTCKVSRGRCVGNRRLSPKLAQLATTDLKQRALDAGAYTFRLVVDGKVLSQGAFTVK